MTGFSTVTRLSQRAAGCLEIAVGALTNCWAPRESQVIAAWTAPRRLRWPRRAGRKKWRVPPLSDRPGPSAPMWRALLAAWPHVFTPKTELATKVDISKIGNYSCFNAFPLST
jgi:hypothetical protein